MKRMLIFDGSNVFNRAYHAVPLMNNSKGLPTNAIKGTVNIVVSCVMHWKATHVAFVFDTPRPTHRHKLFSGYKAGRTKDPMDTELMKAQRKPLYRLLTAMGIKVVFKHGYEADDLIGTIARTASRKGYKVIIVSNDKDIAQCIDENTIMLKYQSHLKAYQEVNLSNCVDIFDVTPDRIPCKLMLLGDGVDGIPGVDGIGPATAVKLIATSDKVETADTSVLNKKQLANFEEARRRFKLIRRLATIDCTIIKISLKSLRVTVPDRAELSAICKELEAKQMMGTMRKWVEYLT